LTGLLKIRFRANGTSSDAIHYWALDNIQIYKEWLNTVADPMIANPVKVYPNPAKSFVNVELPGEIISLFLYNAQDTLVYSQEVQDEMIISLNTQEYPVGVYLLMLVKADEEKQSSRLVIAR